MIPSISHKYVMFIIFIYICSAIAIRLSRPSSDTLNRRDWSPISHSTEFLPTDKQQELDLPSLRIEDAVAAAGSADARAAKKKDRAQRGPAAMSHISGVKRPLTHTNSFTGERVPLHGVETPHEEELGKVSLWPLISRCRGVRRVISYVYRAISQRGSIDRSKDSET